mgnify:CR=1 FL=1
MKDLLQSLCMIPAVRTCLVIDRERRTVLSSAGDELSAEATRETAQAVGEAFDCLSGPSRGWDCVVAQFADGALVVREIDSTAVLAVLAQASANLELIKVASQVGVPRLVQGLLAERRRLSTPVASHPASPGFHAQEVLERCASALSFHIGPIARLIAKRAIHRVVPDGPLTSDQLLEVVSLMERQIDTPSCRTEFRRRLAL